MITNAGPDTRPRVEERFRLDQLCDDIVVSAEAGFSKPDARIYRLSAQRLGVLPAACIFVDDNQQNVDGARRAGMKGLRFTSTADVVHTLSAMLAEET